MIHVLVDRGKNIRSVVGNKITKNYKIEKSDINGQGLFALKNFKKEAKIYSYKKGKIINKSGIKSLSKIEKRHLDRVGEDRFEIIESPGCFINHSCHPNIKEKNRAGYALKNIKKGEEITIDYDKIAYIEKPFRCKCGAKDCRRVVKGK